MNSRLGKKIGTGIMAFLMRNLLHSCNFGGVRTRGRKAIQWFSQGRPSRARSGNMAGFANGSKTGPHSRIRSNRSGMLILLSAKSIWS